MHAWENQDQNILVFTCKPPPPVEPPVWPAGRKLETEQETEEFLNQPCTSRSPLTTPPHDCNQASPPSSPPAIQLDQPLTTPPPNCEQATHLSSPPAIPPDRLLHLRKVTPFYPPPAIQVPLRRATLYHPYQSFTTTNSIPKPIILPQSRILLQPLHRFHRPMFVPSARLSRDKHPISLQ